MSAEPQRRIVVTERASDSALSRLEAVGEVVQLARCDEATLIEAVPDADAMMVRTYSEMTRKVFEAAAKAGRLKVVGRAGVGVDNIDLRAAADAGVIIVHTPAASTHAVADLTVGMIIALQRQIVTGDRRLREGEFESLRKASAHELQHQTLGVIGMGRIGTAVGRRVVHGFGMRVIYHDIREITSLPFVAEPRPNAEAVYAEADVVTFHVPLTKKTRGMVNAGSLSHFKRGSYLVNTSRGPVVQPAAVADALKSGRLAGAALDVHDPEPPPPDYPLFHAPNCILTPHIAARSVEGLAAMNDVVDDIIGVLDGREPVWPARMDEDD